MRVAAARPNAPLVVQHRLHGPASGPSRMVALGGMQKALNASAGGGGGCFVVSHLGGCPIPITGSGLSET
jgi:hypothetical protein